LNCCMLLETISPSCYLPPMDQSDKNTTIGKYLPTYEGCIICGDKKHNPNTLGLRFRATEDGAETFYTPDSMQEGYRNILHGGITSALLDETIGWACALVRKKYFVTVELLVRFIKPIPIGIQLKVTGRETSHSSRFSEGEGEITGSDGTVYAKASAKYFILPEVESKKVHDYLTFGNQDIDILE
jgi:uncharacterized protein (TIGR00369 family)